MIGSFDRIGFQRHSRAFRPADLDVDLSERVCLVTGGNAGLGRAIADALAKRGAPVHLLCRDAGRAEAARDEIRHATGNARVQLAVVDVSDLASVRRYVASAGLERVHVLVHNAGVLPPSRILSADGLELTFATHVIGPHLLTNMLATPLRQSGDARVIFVSSGGMYTQRLDLADFRWDHRHYDGVVAYAQTKRMQVVLAERLSHVFAGAGVSVYSMHPGWADTSGVKTSLPRFHKLTKRVLRSPAQGADTVVWLAVCQPAPKPSGGFWFDRKARGTHYLPWTREDQTTRDRLWEQCQRLAGLT
ncbi:MAG: SDR family NAD(P)-dependent oxidoreductase [Polyangiaceae bacterium]|jgi:NAD(P)-dependent dehydrogenase (short-subunit alcohol dehydrogenase family)|nr:SDR family NAD(P)-dependent oxidoreductase [Polyangiaceae bacterium]